MECISGCGLHISDTKVEPLYMSFRVEVRFQYQGVVMETTIIHYDNVIKGHSS